MNFDYYYGNESEQFSFYRIPKILFKDKLFKEVSTDAKVLYGLMLDRMGLSIRNGWFDKENRVYIVYTISDIMEDLNCADQKAGRLLSELDSVKGIGLIERKRQGLGKPNIIYVKNFRVTSQNQSSENHDSGKVKITNQDTLNSHVKNRDSQISEIVIYTDQEMRKSLTNYTDINDTEENDTDCNNHIPSYPSEDEAILGSDEITSTSKCTISYPMDNNDVMDAIEERKKYRNLIAKNIEFDYVVQNYSLGDAEGILDTMVEAVCSKKDYLRVREERIPQVVVKSKLLKLDYGHIEYVLDCLKKNKTKIHNIQNYMLTALYNAPATIEHYYTAQVNHVLHGND